ncbi:MAG: hypothetical protein ACK5AZ_21500 [Bryobacteraceae bacterium]
MSEPLDDPEIILSQFNRLINELLRGTINRNTFRAWEIELLLDIETCQLRDSGKRTVLRRYQKAVQRQMEKGAPAPIKLSEYLDSHRKRQETPLEISAEP